MIDFLITVLVSAALIVGTYTDIKFMEVPDWVSYAAIFSALGLRMIWSVSSSTFAYILSGAVGFALVLAIASLMFYLGQWGGGDSKLLIGLGALLGLELNFDALFFSFLLNIVLLGALYGLCWAAYLAFKNFSLFQKELKKVNSKYSKLKKLSLYLSAVLVLTAMVMPLEIIFRLLILILSLLLMSAVYLFIFIKAVESACMLKAVSPEKLTEGDWIAKDIIVNGKLICGPADRGVEKKQIMKLLELKKKKVLSKVLIKTGLPFVPVFLLAFIASLAFGNLFFALLSFY